MGCVRIIFASSALVACSLTVSPSELGPKDGGALDAAALDATEARDAPDAGPTYREVVLAAKPIAYYRFEDDALSTVMKDELGQHDGVYVGGVSRGAGGVGGSNALTLVGAEYGLVPGADFTYPQQLASGFTIELWLQMAKAHAADSGSLFFAASTQLMDGGEGGWSLLTFSADWVGFELYAPGVNGAYTDASVPTDRLSHVVAVYTGTANAAVYVDGARRANAGVPTPLLGGALVVGCRAGGQLCFRGRIDELAIYAQALPESVVKEHYAAGR